MTHDTGAGGRGMGLTPRQAELLAYLREREHCPTFDEMQRAIGCASKRGITSLLNGLEERGHIRRLYNRARAIEVLPSKQPIRLAVIYTRADLEQRAALKRASYSTPQLDQCGGVG